MTSTASSKAAGFTLLELLVAIAILALLSVAATTLLGTTLGNQGELRERSERLQSLGMALTILRRDLQQIAPRTGRDLRGDAYPGPLVVYGDDLPELLEFAHFGRRQLPGSFQGSSLEHVLYRLEEERLSRHAAPVADPVTGTPWREQVLLEDVTDFQMEFYDGEQWYPEWPPLDGQALQLPVAMSIRLSTRTWPDLRLEVMMVRGVSDE